MVCAARAADADDTDADAAGDAADDVTADNASTTTTSSCDNDRIHDNDVRYNECCRNRCDAADVVGQCCLWVVRRCFGQQLGELNAAG